MERQTEQPAATATDVEYRLPEPPVDKKRYFNEQELFLLPCPQFVLRETKNAE